MEYSYVNPEWKQKNEEKNRNKKKRNGIRVGIAVLLSCVVMATVIGLFAGVLLANRYLISRDMEKAAAVDEIAPTSAPAAVQEESKEKNEIVAPAEIKPAEASETTASSASQFAYNGVYSRAQICEIAAPSVVGIDVVTPVSFYGRIYESEGSGSGVILTSDGYIATCAHVVEDATKITVILNDDTEYEAKLVGKDSRNDLAIIKIEAANLTAAEIGDSDMLTVGEDVIAIGNPLGELRGTATSGIISALRRPVTVEKVNMELIQTDAAISPGNSGGGLFNAAGKLIGIVNAKASGDNAEGLGFAIPINNVLKEINDLLNYGYITGKAYLGVYTQNVTLRSDYGFWQYNTVSCVQVGDVVAGSAAEKAGIKSGDLILAINDEQVSSNTVLSDIIARYNAGDTVTVKIQRDGQTVELTVTFGEYIPQG